MKALITEKRLLIYASKWNRLKSLYTDEEEPKIAPSIIHSQVDKPISQEIGDLISEVIKLATPNSQISKRWDGAYWPMGIELSFSSRKNFYKAGTEVCDRQ